VSPPPPCPALHVDLRIDGGAHSARPLRTTACGAIGPYAVFGMMPRETARVRGVHATHGVVPARATRQRTAQPRAGLTCGPLDVVEKDAQIAEGPEKRLQHRHQVLRVLCTHTHVSMHGRVPPCTPVQMRPRARALWHRPEEALRGWRQQQVDTPLTALKRLLVALLRMEPLAPLVHREHAHEPLVLGLGRQFLRRRALHQHLRDAPARRAGPAGVRHSRRVPGAPRARRATPTHRICPCSILCLSSISPTTILTASIWVTALFQRAVTSLPQ